MAKELTRQRMECGYVSPLWVSWNAKRRHVILLANSENGTVQGAVATWWTRRSLPTRRQVATAPCTVPIRQRHLPSHPIPKAVAISNGSRYSTSICKRLNQSILDDVDVVEVSGDLKIFFPDVGLQGLPFRRRLDDPPVRLSTYFHRHGEILDVGIPPVGNGAVAFLKPQFERRERGAPEVLVKDRSQVPAGLPVEESHRVLGHDVAIFEPVAVRAQ